MEDASFNYTIGEPPLARSGHKIVADDKYLYVIGGFVQLSSPNRNEIRGEIWRLHLVSNVWQRLDFHEEEFKLAASHAVVKAGDCIFITGGTGVPFGVSILSQLIVINLRRRTQHSLSFRPRFGLPTNMPIATYGHSLVSIPGNGSSSRVLMIGGTTGTIYHRQVYCIDLVTLESELWYDGNDNTSGHSNLELSNRPSGRYKQDAFYYSGHSDSVYVVGGVAALDCCPLNEIFEFSISRRTYTRKKIQGPDPGLLRYPSMCQNAQYIYLTGGLCPQTNSVSTKIWQLDLESLSWTHIGIWSHPAYFHDSVFIGQSGSLYTVGGIIQLIPSQRRTNSVYKVSPVAGRKYRSLQELCWEKLLRMLLPEKNEMTLRSKAISELNSGNLSCAVHFLYTIGVPWSLLSRISRDLDRASFAA